VTVAAPRTCFFGSSKMGSWKIRAQQIASTRATWSSAETLTPQAIVDNDVFVAIKRHYRARLGLLKRLGKVVLYDVLDCWQQPQDGLLCSDMDKVRRWFEAWFADLPVDSVIFPNRTMMEDLGHLVPNPVCIYHHFWPGMKPIEVRRQAQVVGYQGEASYLGPWQRVVERACRRLGLRFETNPRDLRSVDIGLAARGGVHASLMSHRYKSNVKLANFYGAAIPCIVDTAEASYRETDNGEVRFFANAEELEARLEELLPFDTRTRIHRSFLEVRQQFTLEAIADRYDDHLRTMLAPRVPAARGSR
jgi:hypothetical protein